MVEKKRVLFLCVHNSVRSILAEHLTNHFRGDEFAAYSAGLQVSDVHPFAKRVLEEIRIDTKDARSKSVEEFRRRDFDLVVTVCAPSEGECPAWLGVGKRAHLAFDDPSRDLGSEEEMLSRFRALRDEMLAKIFPFLDAQMVERKNSAHPLD